MALQRRDETREANEEGEGEGRRNWSIPNHHNSEEKRTLHLPIKTGQRTPNWELFNNWVHCICIVTFDLELGQAIEVNIVRI